jgi:hypothetical protein
VSAGRKVAQSPRRRRIPSHTGPLIFLEEKDFAASPRPLLAPRF